MAKCPNCFFELVLLSHRQKYKCAKCGRLFPQHEVEVKEFQEFNKRERKNDKEAINGKPQKQTQLSEHEKSLKRKAYYEQNKERLLAMKKEYYDQNKEAIIKQKREYRKGLNEQAKKEQNEKKKNRRMKNTDGNKLQSKIDYQKQQQKVLALRIFENRLNSLYNQQFGNILPTFLLS